jgi:hypothetical protein
MFNTSDVNENAGGKYIKPGVENDVIIHNIMGVLPQSGAPYLEFSFRKPIATPEETTKIKFYMTEKSSAMSLKKVLHIATKVVKRAQIDALKASSVEEYGAMLNKILAGKHLRMKFLGEEYVNAKDEVRTKAVVGLPDFAEAIMEGAEYSPISNNSTKLSFDTDKDVKRLQEAPKTADPIVEDDLPF